MIYGHILIKTLQFKGVDFSVELIMTNHYEVVIIGSGAGGGTLARCLAEAGKKVLVLERGDWLPREPQNWDPSEVFQNNRNLFIDLWKD